MRNGASREPLWLVFLTPSVGLAIQILHGLRITADSTAYVAMAHSVLAAEGLLGWDGSPQGIWPPGFALLLALPLAMDAGPIVAGWALAILNYLAFCGVCYALTRLLVHGPAMRRIAWTMICLGSAISHSFPAILSDGLFLLELTTFLLLWKSSELSAGRREFGLIVMACLMPVTRYIGVIAPVVLLLDAAIRVLRSTATFSLLALRGISLLPLAAFATRNWILLGEPDPSLPGDPRDMAANLRRMSEVIGRWYIPQFDSTDVLRICMAICLLLGIWLLWRSGIGRDRLVDALREHGVLLASLGLYLAIYGIATQTRRLDPPNERLLAPVYVLCTLSFWGVASRLWGDRPFRSWRRGYRVVAGFACAYALYHSVDSAQSTHHWVMRNDLYSEELANAIERVLVDIPSGAQLASNAPDRLYWFTGRRSRWPVCGASVFTAASGPDSRYYLHISDIDRPYLCAPTEQELTILHRVPFGDVARELRLSRVAPSNE